MPANNNAIEEPLLVMSEEVNLGLQLSEDIDIQPLFPGERLLRLHPNWFVSNFSQKGETFTADIKDYATEKISRLSGRLVFNSTKNELLNITLTGTNEIYIRFFNKHNALTVQTRSAREIEPTDPVLLWIRAIREYIRLYIKNTPATLFFRILMNRMVLQMDPSQRKICMMLAKITFVEILVIIFILAGYAVFVL